jgi:hypothetical protein
VFFQCSATSDPRTILSHRVSTSGGSVVENIDAKSQIAVTTASAATAHTRRLFSTFIALVD